MKILSSRVLWGGLLVLGGILFLLQNLNILPINNLIISVLFVIAGLVFLFHLISNPRANWWAVIPGLILAYLGILILMSELSPAFADNLGGGLFLLMIGIAFWVVFLINRTFWWAVIPGGVMTTLAVVAIISEIIPGEQVGGIFFLGLALTFLLLYFLPTPMGRMRWPLIPAGILGVMGIILVATSSEVLRYAWPVILIAAGLFLFLYRGQSRA